MNLELKITNPLLFNRWDEAVLTGKKYSFFHSAAWAKVLIESYNYRPVYFTSMDKNKLSVIVPLMEIRSLFTGKRGVSLPFSDSCYPIVEGSINFKDVLNRILKYGKSRNWKYLEIRGAVQLLRAIQLGSGYAAALVVEGCDGQLKCWEWSL